MLLRGRVPEWQRFHFGTFDEVLVGKATEQQLGRFKVRHLNDELSELIFIPGVAEAGEDDGGAGRLGIAKGRGIDRESVATDFGERFVAFDCVPVDSCLHFAAPTAFFVSLARSSYRLDI